MARVVVNKEAVDGIDTEQAARDILDAIVVDARARAPKGRTGRLAAGIRVASVSRDGGIVESRAENPRSSEGHEEYPVWVEKGTKRSKAQPYLRPAATKYRT